MEATQVGDAASTLAFCISALALTVIVLRTPATPTPRERAQWQGSVLLFSSLIANSGPETLGMPFGIEFAGAMLSIVLAIAAIVRLLSAPPAAAR